MLVCSCAWLIKKWILYEMKFLLVICHSKNYLLPCDVNIKHPQMVQNAVELGLAIIVTIFMKNIDFNGNSSSTGWRNYDTENNKRSKKITQRLVSGCSVAISCYIYIHIASPKTYFIQQKSDGRILLMEKSRSFLYKYSMIFFRLGSSVEDASHIVDAVVSLWCGKPKKKEVK